MGIFFFLIDVPKIKKFSPGDIKKLCRATACVSWFGYTKAEEHESMVQEISVAVMDTVQDVTMPAFHGRLSRVDAQTRQPRGGEDLDRASRAFFNDELPEEEARMEGVEVEAF